MLTKSKTQRIRALAGAAAAAGIALLGGCGAQYKEAPPRAARPERCQSMAALAPALLEALEGANAVHLRAFIERNGLLEEQPDGSPSPMVTLMRVSMATLTSMAHDPPEPGAAPGQLCNELSPPPSRDSNRMCEARRIIQTFLREGKGLDTLRLVDPLVAGALNYVVGRPPSAKVPHYGVAAALSSTCSRADCRTVDTLDTFIRLLAFLEPTAAEPRRPQNVLAKLNALLLDPAMTAVLDQAEQTMGEDDLVGFFKVLLDNALALPPDPEQFAVAYHRNIECKLNDLLTSTLKIGRDDDKYRGFRKALDKVIGPHEKADLEKPHGHPEALLFDLLNPAGAQPFLIPAQAQMACLKKSDPESWMLRLVYGISYAENVVGLIDVLKAVEGLAAQDERLSILTFTKRALEMLKADQEGAGAMRTLCATAFDTSRPADGSPSNAETVVPVLADLFEGGAVGEAVCVLDTLLYGCAGGFQPACPGPGPLPE